VSIKERNLIMSLVELGREDDFIPNGQSNVGIQELIWKSRLRTGAIDGREDSGKSLSDVLMQPASANVYYIAMTGSLML
jgi:hypothetical protein